MNLTKIATSDAANWARAEMFFGEGAGTRRKLLKAEIFSKQEKIPGYFDAFSKAYEKQDFAEHAIKAAKERQSLDRTKFVKRNVRGLVTGNKQSLTSGILLAATIWGVLHQTGLDVPVKREVKKMYQKVQIEAKVLRLNLVRAYKRNKAKRNPRKFDIVG